MTTESPESTAESPRAPARRKRVLVALAIVAAAAALFFALAERTPLLTRADLEAARARWLAAGVTSYDVTIVVENDTRAPETFLSHVLLGEVTSFEMNDRPAPVNSHYSVDGLFSILERELDMLEESERSPGAERPVLRAAFDATYGFPRAFKRLASKHRSTFIHVEHFTVVAPPAGGAAAPAREG